MTTPTPPFRPPTGPPQPGLPNPTSLVDQAIYDYDVERRLDEQRADKLVHRGLVRRVIHAAQTGLSSTFRSPDQRDAEMAALEGRFSGEDETSPSLPGVPLTGKEKRAAYNVHLDDAKHLHHNARAGLDPKSRAINAGEEDKHLRKEIRGIEDDLARVDAEIRNAPTRAARRDAINRKLEMLGQHRALDQRRDPSYRHIGDVEGAISDAQREIANATNTTDRVLAQGRLKMLELQLRDLKRDRFTQSADRIEDFPAAQKARTAAADHERREAVHDKYEERFARRESIKQRSRERQQRRQERREQRAQRREERQQRREQQRQVHQQRRTDRQERRKAVKTGRSNYFFEAPDPSTRVSRLEAKRRGLETDPMLSQSRLRKEARQQVYRRVQQNLPHNAIPKRFRDRRNARIQRQQSVSRHVISA